MHKRPLTLVFSLILITAAFGCQDSEGPGENAASGVRSLGPQTPPPTAPKKLKPRAELEDDCLGMYRLLAKCSGNRRLQSDGHFKRIFLNNCRQEVSRETIYARRFADCARSADCETLDACSRALDAAAGELGPEQVRYLLDKDKRSVAKKFCYDNAKAVEASAELHELCHPLLEEVKAEEAAAGEHGGCPLHGKH